MFMENHPRPKYTERIKELLFLEKQIETTIIENLEKVEDRVFVLLKKDENCRNNDNYLFFKYWVEVDGLDTANLSLDIIKKLTPAESIRRASRKLVALAIENPKELGFLLPTDPEIRLKRAIAEDAYRKWAKK